MKQNLHISLWQKGDNSSEKELMFMKSSYNKIGEKENGL